MKPFPSFLFTALIVASFAAAAGATPEKAAGASPLDCAQWQDKVRCAALNQKIQACRTKTDDAWLDCMYPSDLTASFTPPAPRDCSKARNKQACQAHASALEACKDKSTRAEHRECVTAQMQATSLTKN